MNRHSSFLTNIDKIDKQQAHSDMDDFWGRRIVPLECDCSLTLLDEDISNAFTEISRRLSLSDIGMTAGIGENLDISAEESIASMLEALENDETLIQPKYEPIHERINPVCTTRNIELGGIQSTKKKAKPQFGRQPSPNPQSPPDSAIGTERYDDVLRSSDVSLEQAIASMLEELENNEKVNPLKYEPLCSQINQTYKQPNLSIGLRNIGSTKNKTKSGSAFVLPHDFQPSPNSVIVGKGKESKNAVGNERLRALASSYLLQYAAASDDKHAKSALVSSLVATVRNACPVGAFIKLDKVDGRWYTVSDSVAREKVGYTFRELLGDKYKSSSKAKAAMRNLQRRRLSLLEQLDFYGEQ